MLKRVNNGRQMYLRALRLVAKPGYDAERVIDILRESSRLGVAEATYALATWYLHGKHVKKDLPTAAGLLEEAASKDLPDALFDLAVCYEKGAGVKRSARLAFECYLRAALLGDEQARPEVYRCYYHGIGISKNKRIAEIWRTWGQKTQRTPKTSVAGSKRRADRELR